MRKTSVNITEINLCLKKSVANNHALFKTDYQTK